MALLLIMGGIIAILITFINLLNVLNVMCFNVYLYRLYIIRYRFCVILNI